MKQQDLPAYWKPSYPAYLSLEGYELLKAIQLDIIKLKLRFDKMSRLLIKADQMFKAAVAAKDTYMMVKYSDITGKLYEVQNRCAERLIFDYKEQLPTAN